MKRLLKLAVFGIAAAAAFSSCSKDNEVSFKSPVKEGVWTNYPDRAVTDTSGRKVPVSSNVIPLLMQVSGADVRLSAFSIEKGGINLVPGSLTYDEASNKGTITIPSIGEYGGVATFTMEGEKNMTCITQRNDTVHLAWCSETTDGWWVNRPARDFVIPEGGGLSRDTGVGRGVMDLTKKIFKLTDEDLTGSQTKGAAMDVFNIVAGAVSTASLALSITGLCGNDPSNQEIMDVCYQILDEIGEIEEQLGDIMESLQLISTQIDLLSLQEVINTRNMYVNSLNNSFSGYRTDFEAFMAVPESQRDKEYYTNVRTMLSEWAGEGDKTIVQTLYSTIDYLQKAEYQNGGRMKSGLPAAYDDMLLATVAWEHEGGLGGETFRLADIAAVGTGVDWSMFYLQACKYLGEKTRSRRDPDELLKDINTRSTKLQDYYNKTDIDLNLQSKRRICYIKDAHFKIDKPSLSFLDCNGMAIHNLKSNIQVVEPSKSNYVAATKAGIDPVPYAYIAYDFFQFLGEGDPQVLASQRLVSGAMLDKVCDFYYESGTTEYKNFYRADKISKLMLLDYDGAPAGYSKPWLACYTTPYAIQSMLDSSWVHNLRYGTREEQKMNYKPHGEKRADGLFKLQWCEIADHHSIVYFSGYAYE